MCQTELVAVEGFPTRMNLPKNELYLDTTKLKYETRGEGAYTLNIRKKIRSSIAGD